MASTLKNARILIYGANGFTGRLFAKHLCDQGCSPILAGRNAALGRMGEELDCEVRIFETPQTKNHLEDVDVLVNLAGPFLQTQEDLITACIGTRTQYVDVAAKAPEMKNVHRFNAAALAAEVILIPAAGFSAAPTDVLAHIAAKLIDQPTDLTIGYKTKGGLSRGTLKTGFSTIGQPGVRVRNGSFETAHAMESEATFEAFSHRFQAYYDPWRADLFTARLSTGVANISVYAAFPKFFVRLMKGKDEWLKNLLNKRLVNMLPEGPSERAMAKGKTLITVIAENAKGDRGVAELQGPEAYRFTVLSLEQMVAFALQGDDRSGFVTAAAFGSSWLANMPGVQLRTRVEKQA